MPSKLTVHWGLGGRGLTKVLQAGVVGVKYCAAFPSGEPVGDGVVIGRFYIASDETAWTFGLGVGDPRASALSFAERIWPEVERNPHVRYIESPNEPVVKTPAVMAWLGEFCYEFARIVKARGRLAVIGNFPVGTPEQGLWLYFTKGLQACIDFGALLGVHLYGWLNEHLALRHRANNREFEKLGYFNIPQVATECGAENVEGMKPWTEQYGDAEEGFARYRDEWLLPFAHEIHKDPYLVMATLFTQGTGAADKWRPYDVAGYEDALTRVVRSISDAYPVVARWLQPYHKFPGADRALGVDVSRHQDKDETPQMMNWSWTAQRGVSFALVRASWAATPDPDWEYNVIGAAQAGLLVGAYHYVTFDKDAREQARLFWSQASSHPLALPLFADIEQEPVPVWGAEHVRVFLDEIDRLSGRRTGVYTRASYWDARMFGRGFESGRPLWVAHYKVNAPAVPKGWPSTWDFWQYTSEGDGPTYGAESKYIDLNYYNGTTEALKTRFSAPPPTPPPAQTAQVVWRDGFEDGAAAWNLVHKRSSAENKHPTVNVERKSQGAHPGAIRGGDASLRVIGKWLCWQSELQRAVPLTGLTPGQSCRATAWVRLWASEHDDFPSEPNPEIVARATLRVRLPDGRVIEKTVDGFGWRELAVEWKAAAGNETVSIGLEADLGGENSRWPVLNTAAFWDEVVIEQVGTPPAPVPVDVFPTWTHRVLIAELPVRERPWRDASVPRVVMVLGKGSRVEVTSRDGDWGRIGFQQWIRMREGTNTEKKA